MVGRLHSRQGLQSGRRAAGKSPFLLLDISEFFFLLFFPSGVGGWGGWWMCKHYCHNYIVMVFVRRQPKRRRVQRDSSPEVCFSAV